MRYDARLPPKRCSNQSPLGAILGGFGVFRHSETFSLRGSLADLTLPVFLSFNSFLLPYATGYFNTGNVFDALSVIVVLFPAWPVFILLLSGEKGRFIGVLRVIIIAFWLFIVMAQGLEAAKTAIIDNYQPQIGVEKTIGNVRDLTVNSWDNVKVAFISLQKTPDLLVRKATGQFYPEEVEGPQTGVAFGRVEQETLKLYSDLRNGFLADLRLVGIKEPVEIISFECSNRGAETPAAPFTVEDVRTLRCVYEPDSLSDDDKIEFKAGYKFDTTAKLDLVFIDQERKRILVEKNQLVRQEVVAVSPDKPVAIGTNPFSTPIGLPADGEMQRSVLSVSLNNHWPGQIKRVESLKIDLPEGIVIDKDSCGIPPENPVKQAGREIYAFDTAIINRYVGEGTEQVGFSCEISYGGNLREKLLRNQPEAIEHSIFISTEYVYEIKASKRIEVEESELAKTTNQNQ